MTLRMNVWNVGHGLAIYVKTPDNKHIAIDLATLSANNNLRDFDPIKSLASAGIRQLDMLVITHPHHDHIRGIGSLGQMQLPRVLSRPRHLSPERVERMLALDPLDPNRGVLDQYLALAALFNGPIPPGGDLSVPRTPGSTSVINFAPNPESENINDHSIVTVIEAYGVKILVTGDNESPSWEYLLAQPGFRSAIASTDVLVAAHHGRESGFHANLFDYINPSLTIVSDGPETSTSVTGSYDNVTAGANVLSRNSGQSSRRKVVTTRNDGMIEVQAIPSGEFTVVID